jgi:hypothetical protein
MSHQRGAWGVWRVFSEDIEELVARFDSEEAAQAFADQASEDTAISGRGRGVLRVAGILIL